jgi:hypothetical protein
MSGICLFAQYAYEQGNLDKEDAELCWCRGLSCNYCGRFNVLEWFFNQDVAIAC